jgi:hypothetical protein
MKALVLVGTLLISTADARKADSGKVKPQSNLPGFTPHNEATDYQPASKRHESPPSGVLWGDKDLSEIEFRCQFTDAKGKTIFHSSNTISCDFVQVLLRMPSSDHVAHEIAEADGQFERGWKQDLSKGLTVQEWKKGSCSEPKDKQWYESERRRFQSNQYAAALLLRLDREERFRNHACSCENLSCVHDALKEDTRQSAQAHAESCKITSHSWKLQFRRTGEFWTSVDTSSMCFSSATVTLAHEKESGTGFWMMRTVTVPKPDAVPKICPKAIEESSDSWKDYGGPIPLTCRYMRLGP